jgi:hypothetical protein
MKWFKKEISKKDIEENNNLINVKNKFGKKYVLPGFLLLALSGLIIYKYLVNINDKHHIIPPHSALKYNPTKPSSIPMSTYKTKSLLPPATLKKFSTSNKFSTIKTAMQKKAKQNAKIKKIKYLNHKSISRAAIKTGGYSSIIYRLNKQIEIEKLRHELALIKNGKNTVTMSNAYTASDDNLNAGIFGLPPLQYINPLEATKKNNLSTYFNKNNKQNNTIRLIGVSNKSADVYIGKSDFIIQSGCQLYGYQVLKIGKNSITVAKDAKIKKIYIY